MYALLPGSTRSAFSFLTSLTPITVRLHLAVTHVDFWPNESELRHDFGKVFGSGCDVRIHDRHDREEGRDLDAAVWD